MKSTTNVILNVQLPNYSTVIYAVQGDVMSREISATLLDGSSPFEPPWGADGIIRYRKPDGTVGMYDTMEDETTPAVTVTGNVATILLAEQMLTVVGEVIAQLSFYTGSEERLSTFTFKVIVEANPYTDEAFESTDYYSVLTADIASILAVVENMPAPATVLPLMDGTAAIGVRGEFARSDHVHPSDTSKADAADLTEVNTKLKSTASNSSKTVILIGDSYAGTQGWATGWQAAFENLGVATVYKTAVGGSGFIGDPNVNTFLEQLQGLTVPDKNAVTDIVAMGGYNDASLSYSEADLTTAVQAFASYCKTNYPYAKIHYGFIAIDYRNNGMQGTLNTYRNRFESICLKSGVSFIKNAPYILLDRSKIFISADNANSGFHPNTDGNAEVANKLAEYLFSGDFDVRYSEVISTLNLVVYVVNGQASVFSAGSAVGNHLVAMTYPFNTWTLLIDLSMVSKYLWGKHSDGSAFKFWSPVFTPSGYVAHALFRIYDKGLYVNPLNSTSGMTLSAQGWICPEGFTIPMQANY